MVTIQDSCVEFNFYRPEAKEVFLAGDFNDWQGGDVSMSRGKDGYWKASLPLPAGEFKFRYCADGAWYTDFAAFGVEPGQFGLDSIVRVPAPALKISKPATTEVKIAA